MLVEVLKGAVASLLYAILLCHFAAQNSHMPGAVIRLHVRHGDEGFLFPDLVEAAQLQIDAELQSLGVQNFTIELVDELERSRYIHRYLNLLRQEPNIEKIPLLNDVYLLLLFRSEEDFVGVDPEYMRGYLFYTLQTVHLNDLPFYLAQAVVQHIFNSEIKLFLDGCSLLQHANLKSVTVAVNEVGSFELPSEYIEPAFRGVFEPCKLYLESFLDVQVLETAGPNPDIDCVFTRDPLAQSDTIPLLSSEKDFYMHMDKCVHRVESFLGVPEHPNNNLPMRLQMMRRCLNVCSGHDVLVNGVVNSTYCGESITKVPRGFSREDMKRYMYEYRWFLPGLVLILI